MEEIMLFIDLDSTLLNTRALFASVNALLTERFGAERVAKTYQVAAALGYTQRRHLKLLGADKSFAEAVMKKHSQALKCAPDCVYPGMLDLLRDASRSRRILLLTAGTRETQQSKLTHLPAITSVIADVCIVHTGTKGQAFERITRGNTESAWVVDDDARNLLDVSEHVPATRLVRMDWHGGSHELDGQRWPVARSADELRAHLGL